MSTNAPKDIKKEGVESTTVKTIRKLKDNNKNIQDVEQDQISIKQQQLQQNDKEELKVEEKLLNASQLEDEDESEDDNYDNNLEQKQQDEKQGKHGVDSDQEENTDKKDKKGGKKELLSPNTKLKRQIKPKNTFGVKEDPSEYKSATGEYHNVNMEIAISYVLSKSKLIKEKIEIDKLSVQFLKDNIVENKHFNLAYNSYIQKLINKKQLNPDFKSVSKKTMVRLEKFFIERIDKQIESLKIHQEYIDKAKYIQDQFDQRIQQLKEKIKEKNKIN